MTKRTGRPRVKKTLEEIVNNDDASSSLSNDHSHDGSRHSENFNSLSEFKNQFLKQEKYQRIIDSSIRAFEEIINMRSEMEESSHTEQLIVEELKNIYDNFENGTLKCISPILVVKTTQSKLMDPFFIKETDDMMSISSDDEEDDYTIKRTSEMQPLDVFEVCVFRSESRYATVKSLLSYLQSKYDKPQFSDLLGEVKRKSKCGIIFIFENAHVIDAITQWIDICSHYSHLMPIINILRVDEKGKDVLEGLITDMSKFTIKVFKTQSMTKPLFMRCMDELFIQKNYNICLRPSFDIITFLINNFSTMRKFSITLKQLYTRHFFYRPISVFSKAFFTLDNTKCLQVLFSDELYPMLRELPSVNSFFGETISEDQALSCINQFRFFFYLHPYIIELIEVAMKCLVVLENSVREKIEQRDETKSDDIISLRVRIHQSLIGARSFKEQNWFKKIIQALKGNIPSSNIIDFLGCCQVIIDEIRRRQPQFYEDEYNVIVELFETVTMPKDHDTSFGKDSTIPIEIFTKDDQKECDNESDKSEDLVPSIDTNQLIPKPKDFCFCNVMIKPKEKVTCTTCGNSFHKACVGVVNLPNQTYYCDSCRRHTNEDSLYCFCQQPSDFSDMLACDNCCKWFHCSCIGEHIENYPGDVKYLCKYCISLIEYQSGKNLKKLDTNCKCGKPCQQNEMIQCERCKRHYHFGCMNLTLSIVETIQRYYCDDCCQKYDDEIEYKKKSNVKRRRSNVAEKVGSSIPMHNVASTTWERIQSRLRTLFMDLFASPSSVYKVDFIFNDKDDHKKPWVERLVGNELFFIQPAFCQTLEQFLRPMTRRETFENNLAFCQPVLFLSENKTEKFSAPDIYLAKQALGQCKMNARYEIDYEEWLDRFAQMKGSKKTNTKLQSLFNMQVRALYLRGVIDLTKNRGVVKRII
ncbi:hypothetical protein FDP41_000508 [Naegleria fowleri]|uniref:PHD-type domain-containing protein n=1 Tax=Naegleria fowleri TaxID=5763 RepID=A0A6A5CH36_NAEFO|nr:uncharacterized protein FDP41_000508 [Naegleria fowleri]KAF0984609.1 hypothetical protein FDP41_000508 [Naegleria fowleri]